MPATLSRAAAPAIGFVGGRRAAAEALGRALADDVNDPDRFAAVLREGFAVLADPDDRAATLRIAPGIGDIHGLRRPLNEAVARGFRDATRGERTSSWLFIADRLLSEPKLEARWFAFGLLEQLVLDDTERAWQLLRRAACDAGDWITVDALAHPIAGGILNEPYRWAELEQLVYSPSRWERRLVGSTIATIPVIDRRRGRTQEVAAHGLDLIRELIGDADPDVQKALAWALRSMAVVDRPATTMFLAGESEQAAAAGDGNRAWVIRDVLSRIDDPAAGRIRERLAGVRRRTGSASTSRAAETAKRFGNGILGRSMPEPPLV